MRKVLLYSVLLVAGMGLSQIPGVAEWRWFSEALTMICLAYIMIEVGLEFVIDKRNIGQYGKDYLIAATAAGFPWIFCAIYFIAMFGLGQKESWLLGRFASPTSAGVLFTMLAAAGLASTSVFKKARVLAIFDDLDTVLFMIPLQMWIVGLKPVMFVVVVIIALLLWFAYRYLHQIKIPINSRAMLIYGFILWVICTAFYKVTHVHFEVLLPAFCLGCAIYNAGHSEGLAEHEKTKKWFDLDHIIKALFMLMVGLSLPKINLEGTGLSILIGHVLLLTLLSNIGKCFPLLCYRTSMSLKERLALSVAMFPRGEVGGGVLVVSLSYGIGGIAATTAALSLALNLLMTGAFILVVKRLIADKPTLRPQ
jgi:Kef-type K+ transport system membrane component KefB